MQNVLCTGKFNWPRNNIPLSHVLNFTESERCRLIFMRFSQAHHSVCPGPSGWYPFLPSVSTVLHSLVLSANLQRVQLIPLFMSPTTVFNSSGTSSYPYRTLLIIGLHLDIKLLTTPLWMCPSNQSVFQLEVHPSNPCLQFRAKEVLWDSVMLCTNPGRWHQLLFSYPPLLLLL